MKPGSEDLITKPRTAGYANGRARRRTIVAMAAEHFAVSGFEGTTLRDIAAAVGISRAGLTRHFQTKEALLQAVLEDRDTRDRRHFGRYAGVAGGLGVLQGMIDLVKHNEQTPGMINLFSRLSTEAVNPQHPAHTYFQKRYASIVGGTARVLRAAAAAGYLKPEIDADGAAIQLTALMDGLQMQWGFEPELTMHTHLHTAITGLLTPGGTDALKRVSPAA